MPIAGWLFIAFAAFVIAVYIWSRTDKGKKWLLYVYEKELKHSKAIPLKTTGIHIIKMEPFDSTHYLIINNAWEIKLLNKHTQRSAPRHHRCRDAITDTKTPVPRAGAPKRPQPVRDWRQIRYLVFLP